MVYVQPVGVLFQHRHTIVTCIDGMTDKHEPVLGLKMIIDPFHFPGHHGTNGWTGCKKEIGDVYFTLKCFPGHFIAVLIDKTKLGNGVEYGVSVFLNIRNTQNGQFGIVSRLTGQHQNKYHH